jgi:hypothetical protein
MGARTGLGNGLKLIRLIIIDGLPDGAGGAGKDFYTGGIKDAESVGAAVTGQHSLYAFVHNHLGSGDAGTMSRGNAGIGCYLELHAVKVDNQEILTAAETRVYLFVQALSRCRNSYFHLYILLIIRRAVVNIYSTAAGFLLRVPPVGVLPARTVLSGLSIHLCASAPVKPGGADRFYAGASAGGV